MINTENHIGKIIVSEKYLTELLKHTVTSCFGVADICSVSAVQSALSALSGGRITEKNKGVNIYTDKDGGLVIDLHIKVTYGTNVAAVVDSIIHKVSFTIEEAVNIPVHKVNVFVDGMNY